jgi:uncharacterized protein YbbC (DUF1343 family)
MLTMGCENLLCFFPPAIIRLAIKSSVFNFYLVLVQCLSRASNAKVFNLSTHKHLFGFIIGLGLIMGFLACTAQTPMSRTHGIQKTNDNIKPGAYRTDLYLPLLKGKRVAIVGNQTSMVGRLHLLDTLISLGIKVNKVFSPEHGFRGTEDAGAKIKSQIDKKTGLPIISLYGKNYKPKPADLADVDLVIFDIQDVGARFYTYLSTLHYVMEACAENNKTLIVLDRPNPNGYFVDGPVLEAKNKSFVGLHPVPIVYGMTIGEYARMINGEGWLKDSVKCSLQVISLDGYTHKDFYSLPVKPSPNLPNMASVYLYPSLALFEGTIVSVGRGTEFPFQVIGHPTLEKAEFTFTPKSTPGAKNPMYKDTLCHGIDLRVFGAEYMKFNRHLYLSWLLDSYKNTPDKSRYFNNYFNSLAGNSALKQQVIDGLSEDEIRKSWEPALGDFKTMRKKYLLYEDFE